VPDDQAYSKNSALCLKAGILYPFRNPPPARSRLLSAPCPSLAFTPARSRQMVDRRDCCAYGRRRIGHQLALPPDTRIAWMPARRIDQDKWARSDATASGRSRTLCPRSAYFVKPIFACCMHLGRPMGIRRSPRRTRSHHCSPSLARHMASHDLNHLAQIRELAVTDREFVAIRD